jgi:hypothetical protein
MMASFHSVPVLHKNEVDQHTRMRCEWSNWDASRCRWSHSVPLPRQRTPVAPPSKSQATGPTGGRSSSARRASSLSWRGLQELGLFAFSSSALASCPILQPARPSLPSQSCPLVMPVHIETSASPCWLGGSIHLERAVRRTPQIHRPLTAKRLDARTATLPRAVLPSRRVHPSIFRLRCIALRRSAIVRLRKTTPIPATTRQVSR